MLSSLYHNRNVRIAELCSVEVRVALDSEERIIACFVELRTEKRERMGVDLAVLWF